MVKKRCADSLNVNNRHMQRCNKKSDRGLGKYADRRGP